MKKNLLCFYVIAFALSALKSSGQITITENDMPSVGNTFIVTTAATDVYIDVDQTGTNYNWDFIGGLIPLYSQGDTFIDELDLPLTYILFFLGSNLAAKSGVNVDFNGLTLSDVYTVYKKNSSQFEIDGYAGTFQGIPVPLVYSSKDIVYRFPLEFGDKDSSDASISYSFPGLFYFSQQRHRVNEVDGWGTIKTPIGEFDVLRVKSSITDIDSFYLDTLNFGTSASLKSYEYKWLAQASGIPVMQVNAQDVFGYPLVTQILYQDTAFQTGITETVTSSTVKIFPNPASEFVRFESDQNKPSTVFIYDAYGRKMREIKTGESFLVRASDWANGVYFAQYVRDGKSTSAPFIVNHTR